MKLTTLAFVGVICLVAAVYGGFVIWANNAEKAPYTITQSWDNIELRNYPNLVLAEVAVDKSYDDAGNTAFRTLFKYISGENSASAKIEMTAPVMQQPADSDGEEISMTSPVLQSKSDDGWYVAFVLPAKYTLETAPQPKNPKVMLKQTGPRDIVAITFTGFWSESRFNREADKLAEALTEKGLSFNPTPIIARYNPPFTPPFLRRNEVMFELTNQN